MKSGSQFDLVLPKWPAPKNIRSFCTTRNGGVSKGEYRSLNLGAHVGDVPELVALNRARLPIHAQPSWLNQVHGNKVVSLSQNDESPVDADACYTQSAEVICAVMTADCLPILVTNYQGDFVAAVHAGWRGLQQNIIAATIAKYPGAAADLLFWIGPCISQSAFEVGEDVKVQFLDYEDAFIATQKPGKYLMSMEHIAQAQAKQCGVNEISVAGQCTYTQPEKFYSYRRDGQTGRMATLIWIQPE